jgi:mono/diheme cytochrome c family protein
MAAGLRRSFRASSLSLAFLCVGALAVRSETPIERGTYLMHSVVACGNCHTPKDRDGKAIADRELAGGFEINAPIFHAVSPNITPDKESGIGNWTDDQIVNAIRNGKRPNGTIIGPPMPIAYYRNMSDSDVRAIVAYLRTVKPIKNKTEKSTYKIPLPAQYGPTVTSVPDMPHTDKVAYGQYLATALGHCMDCHTPLVNGRNDMTRIGAGGREFEAPGGGLITSANLTPANNAGIAQWTDAQVRNAITHGVRPDRPLVPLMAFEWYKNISTDDLDALVAYLRTLKPAVP